MTLDQLALGVHGEIGLGHGSPVIGAEPVVVIDPPGTDLALEVAVGARPVGSEGRDGGVEVPPADPGQLGEGVRDPLGRQVLEDLEGRHQVEGPSGQGSPAKRFATRTWPTAPGVAWSMA